MMSIWFWYAIAAAVLYGLHQVFTKLASSHISEGLGALIVEASATVCVGVYLLVLLLTGAWVQKTTTIGTVYSVLTGICVGAGTVVFFLLFQRGGPLSAVPMVLAGGAALMALVGIVFFKETLTFTKAAGMAFSIVGLYLLSFSTK